MVMIFKEAMTNTFKHSRGNTVTLQLDIKASQFDFSYCDNGGYDGAKRYSGRGMKNMVDRASSINCQLNYFFTDSRVEVILLGSLNNS